MSVKPKNSPIFIDYLGNYIRNVFIQRKKKRSMGRKRLEKIRSNSEYKQYN